jgi:hypothetical protein
MKTMSKKPSLDQAAEKHAEWVLSRIGPELLTPERITGCIRVLKHLRRRINRSGRSETGGAYKTGPARSQPPF